MSGMTWELDNVDEPLDLDAIKERFENCVLDDISSTDMGDLIAEVERLRKEQPLYYST